MMTTLIFDLSEVLIAGLVGIEPILSVHLGVAESSISQALYGPSITRLFCGDLTEDEYLAALVAHNEWNIDVEELKRIIRRNFHRGVPGMTDLVADLRARHDLVLLSDHASEWIDYIKGIHPFLNDFRRQYFSFELKRTKRDAATFSAVLAALEKTPGQCIFIDDYEPNLATAASVGIPSIQFLSAAQLRDDLHHRGVVV